MMLPSVRWPAEDRSVHIGHKTLQLEHGTVLKQTVGLKLAQATPL